MNDHQPQKSTQIVEEKNITNDMEMDEVERLLSELKEGQV